MTWAENEHPTWRAPLLGPVRPVRHPVAIARRRGALAGSKMAHSTTMDTITNYLTESLLAGDLCGQPRRVLEGPPHALQPSPGRGSLARLPVASLVPAQCARLLGGVEGVGTDMRSSGRRRWQQYLGARPPSLQYIHSRCRRRVRISAGAKRSLPWPSEKDS